MSGLIKEQTVDIESGGKVGTLRGRLGRSTGRVHEKVSAGKIEKKGRGGNSAQGAQGALGRILRRTGGWATRGLKLGGKFQKSTAQAAGALLKRSNPALGGSSKMRTCLAKLGTFCAAVGPQVPVDPLQSLFEVEAGKSGFQRIRSQDTVRGSLLATGVKWCGKLILGKKYPQTGGDRRDIGCKPIEKKRMLSQIRKDAKRSKVPKSKC